MLINGTLTVVHFIRNIKVTQSPRILYKSLLKHCAHHEYKTRHDKERRFNLPKVGTSFIRITVMYKAVVGWNTLQGYLIQANTK